MKNLENLEEKSILYVEDFPVKLSQSLESNWDLKILEELCSMKLLERPNKSNHAICFLKTSETFYRTTKEKRSRECLKSYMTWGMTLNGKCLTAKISEFPKTEKECSLSDILEENVPEEFLLSQKVASKLIQSKSSTAIPLQPDMATHKEQGRTLLKVNRRK